LLVNVQLPDSASVGRTEQVMERIERIAGKSPGVSHTVAIAGQSILLNANAPNFGAMYVMLNDFRHRLRRDLSGDAIAERLREAFRDEVRDGLINIFAAPPVEGLGTAGGFKIVIEDRGDNGLPALEAAAHRAVENGAADPRPARPLHQLPGHDPLALPSTSTGRPPRPGASPSPKCSTRSRSFRLALRQRLQPLRPDLAGQRAGFARLS